MSKNKKELTQICITEFDGEFFEKIESCDKIIYDTCITEGVDYCE